MMRAATWCALLVLPLSGWGCTVPVFTFELRSVTVSPHALCVGTADVEAATRLLGDDQANLRIALADDVAPGQAELRFPGDERPWATIALAQPDPRAVTESPARAEIARRLLAGDAVVWLLLDSGNADADSRARALLDDRLARFTAAAEQRRQERPAPAPANPIQDDAPAPKIAFAVVEVHAGDPAETWLLRQVDHLSTAATGEPRLVPIFGRGRALDPLGGAQIDAQSIDGIAIFLCGDCSCQVQANNPGHELLLAVDWDRRLAEMPAETPPAAAQPELIRTVPPVEATTAPTAIAPPADGAEPRRGSVLVVLGILLGTAALVLLGQLIRRPRSRRIP